MIKEHQVDKEISHIIYFKKAFQVMKVLLFLDENGFNQDLVTCFIEMMLQLNVAELVLATIEAIKELIDLGGGEFDDLLTNLSFERNLVLKWFSIINCGQVNQIIIPEDKYTKVVTTNDDSDS